MTWLLLLALQVSPAESVSLAPDSPCAPRAALARELARVGVSLAEGGGDLEVRLTPTAAGLELSVSRRDALVLRRALQGSCEEAGGATAVILERYLHELPAPQVKVKSPAPSAPSAPAPRPEGPARRVTARPLATAPPNVSAPPLAVPPPIPPPSVSAPTPLPPPPSVSAPTPLPPPPSVSAPTPLPPPPSVSAPASLARDDESPRRSEALPPSSAKPAEALEPVPVPMPMPVPVPVPVPEARRAPPPVVTIDVRPGPQAPLAPISITDWQVLVGGGALGPTPTTTMLTPLLQLHASLLLVDRWRLGLVALFSLGSSVPVIQSSAGQASVTRGTLSTHDVLALPQASVCTGAAALRLCGGALAGLRVTAGQATGDLLFRTALRLAPTFTAGAQVDATLRLGAFRAGLAATLLVNPAPATFGIEGLDASLTTSQLEGFVTLSVGIGPV